MTKASIIKAAYIGGGVICVAVMLAFWGFTTFWAVDPGAHQ